MNTRRFKTGDIVRQKSGGQAMTVIKYATKKDKIFGVFLSKTDVVCGWYDPITDTRRTQIFHQNQLEHANTVPIYLGYANPNSMGNEDEWAYF